MKIDDLSLTNYGYVKDRNYQLAILPWGATEPHNYHLPYLTDCILSHDVAADAAKMAKEQYGINTMILPPVMMGSQNPGQRDLNFCIHYRYETQKAILLRDLAVDYPDFLIAVSDWFATCKAAEYFDRPGDHADELETSVMMHYHPELVDLTEAGTGEFKPFAAESLNAKTAWTPRNWLKVSKDTGVGDPSLSTAEKGKRFAEAVCRKYADLIRDLASGNIYLD